MRFIIRSKRSSRVSCGAQWYTLSIPSKRGLAIACVVYGGCGAADVLRLTNIFVPNELADCDGPIVELCFKADFRRRTRRRHPHRRRTNPRYGAAAGCGAV